MRSALDAIAGLVREERGRGPDNVATLPGVVEIGRSRDGRPLHGANYGQGPTNVSLIAGAHADEPVGPATLAALCHFLATDRRAGPLLESARWTICPHVNPDGAARNAAWSAVDTDAFDLRHYLEHAVRERPGEDIEFGFPRSTDDDAARPENRCVASFLAETSPHDFHASLHGMAIAEGAWFLVNREKSESTGPLRAALARFAEHEGVGLHDWDRRGEKGFERIERGFSTTPTSIAMREHFLALGDAAEAAKFRPSSMEFVASLGGNPLCMVSEMPLFSIRPTPTDDPVPGRHFLEAKDSLRAAAAASRAGNDSPLRELEARHGLRPVPRHTATRVQLAIILLGSGVATLEQLLPED